MSCRSAPDHSRQRNTSSSITITTLITTSVTIAVVYHSSKYSNRRHDFRLSSAQLRQLQQPLLRPPRFQHPLLRLLPLPLLLLLPPPPPPPPPLPPPHQRRRRLQGHLLHGAIDLKTAISTTTGLTMAQPTVVKAKSTRMTTVIAIGKSRSRT